MLKILPQQEMADDPLELRDVGLLVSHYKQHNRRSHL